MQQRFLVSASAENRGCFGRPDIWWDGSNDKGATAVVTRYGYGRGEFFEGYDASRGTVLALQAASAAWKRIPRNTTNPMIGSGMQQARDLAAEQAVEVVQNHEDGTGSVSLAAYRPKGGGNVIRE